MRRILWVGVFAFIVLVGMPLVSIAQPTCWDCGGPGSGACYSCHITQNAAECRSGLSSGWDSCEEAIQGCILGNECGHAVLVGPDLKPVIVAARDICPSLDGQVTKTRTRL
jgi:hypothetical protein